MTDVRDPLVLYNKTRFSIDEYLRFEKESPEKHEFFQGEIFAMSGARVRHNITFSNLFGELAHRQVLLMIWLITQIYTNPKMELQKRIFRRIFILVKNEIRSALDFKFDFS